MGTFELLEQKVFIDKNVMDQLGIGMGELEQMVRVNPDKYVLS